jgi:hypothetical protein
MNIKIDLKETKSDDVDWIHLAQDRNKWRTVINTAINFWIP